MTVFKCKMCGGTLEITEGASICTCEFCDTVQTIPTIQDEGLQNLFNRANVLRMKSEFDKASEIYEKILQKSSEEAEAYWGLILCKYGIEYVEDPDTFKRIPTCHRASYDSVIADDDYKMAIKYADLSQKAIYEEEAKVIDEVQKGIIALAQQADPYDVFICYKETDENGQRTQDSVISNDIYYQLTQEGFKVFYAAITLEDKLGSEYEPYIFSALNTAKVLLSIGTKPEYFNAVWVKNEWSRFLKIMKKDRSKMLIPCYKDMDAYELPEEFAHLQAQNMGKIGFINDLVRGIKKVIVKEVDKASSETTVIQTAHSSNIQALLDRGQMALEDSEWGKADGFYEEVLNQDAKCADAYLGKLLATNKVDSLDKYFSKLESKYSSSTTEDLCACEEEAEHINSVVHENVLKGYLEEDAIKKLYDFDRRYSSALLCREEQKKIQQSEIDDDKLLSRVRQYATGELKEQIDSGLEKLTSIHDARIAEEQRADELRIAEVTDNYAAHLKVADEKAIKLRANADKEKYKDYEALVIALDSATTISAYEKIRESFKALGNYESSVEYVKTCRSEIDRIIQEERLEKQRVQEEKLKEKNRVARNIKRITIISLSAAVAVVALIVIIVKVVIPNNNYNKAIALMSNGQYSQAIAVFEKLDGYKDSDAQILECSYNLAVSYMNEEQYDDAVATFSLLNGYKDSNTLILECNYSLAVTYMNEEQYNDAVVVFGLLNGYQDSEELKAECEISNLSSLNIGDSFYYGNYNDELLEWTILDIQDSRMLIVAKVAFGNVPYNDSYVDVTWSSCSLRTWLNNDFYNSAFSTEEQARINLTTINPDNNPNYSAEASSITEDKIFLLSIDEANQYFSTDSSRTWELNGHSCCWWLRSPGRDQEDCAAVVSGDGSVDSVGVYVAHNGVAVRPALWINLQS